MTCLSAKTAVGGWKVNSACSSQPRSYIFSFFPGCHLYVFFSLCFHWALHTMFLRPSLGTVAPKSQDKISCSILTLLFSLLWTFSPLSSGDRYNYPIVVSDMDRKYSLWLWHIEILYASINQGEGYNLIFPSRCLYTCFSDSDSSTGSICLEVQEILCSRLSLHLTS